MAGTGDISINLNQVGKQQFGPKNAERDETQERITLRPVEPTVEDWLSWATDSDIDTVIWDFINHNRNHLEHAGDFEPNKVYPSRRSWERLNECLTRADMLGESSPTLFNLTAAFVGFEAAVSFNDFVANYDRQVSPEDILVKGDFSKVTDFGINDHTALIDKFEAAESFKDLLPDEQVANLARYFLILPSEVAMKLWSVLGTGQLDNTINLHKASVDGKSVSKYLVEILAGDENKGAE